VDKPYHESREKLETLLIIQFIVVAIDWIFFIYPAMVFI